jgi:phthalate 4,5-dioxygenase
MLTPQDNERITRVGRGTPMGEVFRRYWIPAALSEELPDPDGPPVRVRLLGEKLVAFRDSNGKVGLLEDACPHRRAPMFFGRNEACGLRCVYHGWKFDAAGACTDMPSEPPDSLFKSKVTIQAYPTWEGGGVVWTYMGPPAQMPPPPDYEWVRAPGTHRFASKTFEQCNWLQAMEGGLDTAHSSFAHNERLGELDWIRNRDGHPRLDVVKTDYGYCYSSTRSMDDEHEYVRIYHYVMPAMQLRGNTTAWTGNGEKVKIPKLDGHVWVPINDEETFVYNFMYSYDPKIPIPLEYAWQEEKKFGRGKGDVLPGYRLKSSIENDYFIDREMQRTKNYTGIVGINTQDFALQEGMGPIVDRSKERLGTSDKAIIAARQLLLEASYAVADGHVPRGAMPENYRNVRAYDGFVRVGDDWRAAFASDLAVRF